MGVLTGAEVYVCDFHREQSWLRWTALTKHGVSAVRDELLELLRDTARAPDVDAFDAAVEKLQASRVYQKNETLQGWFQKTWLPHKQASVRNCSSSYTQDTYNEKLR